MKKTKKKWLSFLLAFAVGISACTSAIAAFASPADVEAVKKAIEALETKADVTATLTDQYKGLTDEEKESIEPQLIHKLYNLRYQASTKRPPTPINKIKDTIAALGDYTENMLAGIKLSGAMQYILPVPYTNAAGDLVEDQPLPSTPNFNDENYRLQYEAYKQMWADATDYQRQIADLGGYYTGSVSFIGYYDLSTASTKEYVATFYAEQQYLGKTPDQIQESFKSFPWSPYSAGYFDAVAEYADAYNTFVQGQMASADFVAKVNAIDESKLPNADNINLGNVWPFAILKDGVYTSVPASSVFSAMRAEASALTPMLDFYSLLDSITVPGAPSKEFNDTVATVRVAAANLAKQGKYNLETVKTDNPTAYEKYETILDCYFNDLVTKDGMAETHTSFDEEIVKYEMSRPYGDILVKTLLPAIDGLDDLGPVADQLLFTNANVQPVVILLAGLLGTEATPKDIASNLESYPDQAGLVARLSAYNSWDEVPAGFDWGVAPGDYESYFTVVFGAWGFIPAVVETLLPNTIEYGADGYMSTCTLGLYETVIIPLLEAFGAENVMDSATFTAKYQEAMANPTTMAQVFEPLMIVIRQVYGVYRQILNDPITYLSTNLPNLVYHLEDGCIFDAIGVLVDGLGGLLGDVSAIKQYLSLEGIFNALTPVLEQAGIKLDINDIKKFAHLGKATVVPTASMSYETTIYVVGNQDSVIAQLSKILEPIALQLLDSGLGFSFDPLKDFVKVEAPKYPHDGKMGKDVMLAMIDGLDGLLGGFVNLNDTINSMLCTPEMAANAITGIYTALANINIAGISIPEIATPKLVASMLTEDKYKDICAALQVDSWNDVALVLKNGDTVAYQVDMGFKAGDRQGFVDCIVASLRPLVAALADLGLLTNTLAQDGTVEGYGLYETVIIPLFEALGVKPATDSATYTSNYNKLILKADKGAAYDYLVKTVLSPVLDLVNQLAASPAATLMELLPNLAYAVQYNEDLAFIGNLLAGEDGNIDLAGMVNGLIGGLLPGFELPAIPLDALASCGEVKTMKSMSQLHESYTNVVADKADAFVTVFYYLYDAINYKDNLNTIKELISGIEGIDPSLQTMISTLLNDVFTAGKEEALCQMGMLLASDLWECPNGDSGENSGKTTPSAGDASIAAAVILPVMFAAGAAILFLRKKKKAEAI